MTADEIPAARPKISVIITAYNAEQFIERCVRSVQSNTFRDYELLIVDDGSDDATPDIIRDLQAQDDRIRIISQPNGGESSARNAGLQAARCEYIAYIDADDWVTDNYLAEMYRRIDSEHLDWVYGSYREMYGDDAGNIVGTGRASLSFRHDVTVYDEQARDLVKRAVFSGPGHMDSISGCALSMYRRSVIIDSGVTFDEDIRYGPDMLFNYELAQHISGFGYSTDVMYYYLQQRHSVLHSLSAVKYIDSAEQLLAALEHIRAARGDALTREEKAYLFTVIYHTFTDYIADGSTRSEREHIYERLRLMLRREPACDIWKQMKIYRPWEIRGNLYGFIVFWLYKAGCFEMMYRLRRLRRRLH